MDNIKINEETTVYPGFLKVKQASITETLKDGSEITYVRQKLCRSDAVGAFIYNKDTDSVILIKQSRYAIFKKYDGNLLEIVAGKIDKDESPADALGREVEEEIGYNLKPENVFYLTKTFMSCGYTDERVYFYAAIVTNENKVSVGGGLDSECENIETVEIKMSDFLLLLSNNQLEDAKTALASHLAINLFKSKNLI